MTEIISNFFNSITRIGTDECDKTNKNIQNSRAANYLLENFSAHNSFIDALNLANSQPNILIQGSTKGGIDGSYIDDNSRLNFSKIDKESTRAVNHQRLFTTTPYLGRGVFDVNTSNQFNNPILNSSRKTSDPNSELTHDSFKYVPLLPTIEATISNPANLVEGAAYPDWIRGGQSSRLIFRDLDEKKN